MRGDASGGTGGIGLSAVRGPGASPRGAVGLAALLHLAVSGAALAVSAAPASAQGPASALATRHGQLPHVRGKSYAVTLREGDRFVAGTCGVAAGRRQGDTMLRLRDPGGDVVAFNDDACGTLGSRIEYRVPAGRGGTYQLTPDCYGLSSCGGTVGYTVEAGEPPSPPIARPAFRLRVGARGLYSLDQPGGALLADGVVEVRPVELLVLRLAGAPLGLGGGEAGGLFGGSVHLLALLDLGPVAMGVGGGVGTLARRFENVDALETGVFVTRARVGERFDGFSVFGQLSLGDLGGLEVVSGEVGARLALREVELSARARAGHDGVALVEVAATIWVLRAQVQPRFGISVHAGGGGVFYEPTCRFGMSCGQERWYAGPTLGAGLEWRE